MDLYLYNTKDDENVINKSLTDEKHFRITFKDLAEIKTPKILLETGELILYNYAYIPNFKRYYFIENIVMVNDRVIQLNLVCDVLESFKDDILNSYGVISRYENGNKYFDGGDYFVETRKESDVYNSDVEMLFENENVLLVTIGG